MASEILGVNVFSAGTWNRMKFTGEDLTAIAQNTNALIAAGRHAPPLKLGHHGGDEPEIDGQPALGWIENLRAVGDNLYADFKRIPDTVFEAIKSELYRQVSVELRYIEEFGWILTAVALLGADLPAVKNLEDLQAYLSAHPPVGNPSAGAGVAQALTFSVSAPSINGGPVMPEPTVNTDVLMAEATQRIRELERKSAFKIAFSEGKSGLENQVREGKLTPALRDKIVAAWEKREVRFSVGDSLDIPNELLGDLMAMSATMPKGETAKGGNGDPVNVQDKDAEMPDAELARKSQLLMSQRPDLGYDGASRQVMLSEPALKRRYLDDAQARVISLVTGSKYVPITAGVNHGNG